MNWQEPKPRPKPPDPLPEPIPQPAPDPVPEPDPERNTFSSRRAPAGFPIELTGRGELASTTVFAGRGSG